MKQDVGNIGKDVTEPLSYQETTSKAWEKKPKSYIIFKDLLKSYATQVLSLSLSQTLIIILFIPYMHFTTDHSVWIIAT